jgi:hypothetical protein
VSPQNSVGKKARGIHHPNIDFLDTTLEGSCASHAGREERYKPLPEIQLDPGQIAARSKQKIEQFVSGLDNLNFSLLIYRNAAPSPVGDHTCQI